MEDKIMPNFDYASLYPTIIQKYFDDRFKMKKLENINNESII